MSPLVSIVIPTAARPEFLPRAVRSALEGPHAGLTEVIVVPNGPDDSWRQSLASFNGNAALRVLPITTANANAARNRGMAAATGKYLRFLDDDDYLYPEACLAQYELLESSGADLCSGGLEYLGREGKPYSLALQPDTDDLLEAVLSPQRRAIPVMHAYRRSSLRDMTWRESVPFLQDVQWLLDYGVAAERHWVKLDRAVGTWQQHSGARVSTAISSRLGVHAKQASVAQMIAGTVEALERDNRMTPARRTAATAGMWKCIHAAFPHRPLYWTHVARGVLRSAPGTRPDMDLYHFAAARGINPILVETLVLPKRWLNLLVGLVADRLGLREVP